MVHELVVLIERRNRLIEPVVALTLDDNVEVQRERHAVAQRRARAFGKLEIDRGVELVDAFGRFNVRRADLEACLRLRKL